MGRLSLIQSELPVHWIDFSQRHNHEEDLISIPATEPAKLAMSSGARGRQTFDTSQDLRSDGLRS